MSNFCTKCGKEIEKGKAFCSGCGTPIKIVEIEQDVKSFAPSTQSNIKQQSITNQNSSNFENVNRVENEKYEAIKTGYYFWMILLYSIPIIGWLICIITIFAAKNKSKKNFSKAILIWLIIGLIFTLIISLVIGWVGNKVKGYVQDITEEYNIENIQDVDLNESLKNQIDINEIQNITKDVNKNTDINKNVNTENSNISMETVTESDFESVTELLKMLQQFDKN